MIEAIFTPRLWRIVMTSNVVVHACRRNIMHRTSHRARVDVHDVPLSLDIGSMFEAILIPGL